MYPDKNKFQKQPKKFTLLTQSLICFTWWKKYLLMNTFKNLLDLGYHQVEPYEITDSHLFFN